MADESKTSSPTKALSMGDTRSFSTKSEDEAAARGASILVVFELPEGKEEECSFSLGHTVGQLKWHLERTRGYSYASMRLFSEGKVMIDPLSLADFTSIVAMGAARIKVVVEGDDDGDGGGKEDEAAADGKDAE